MHPRKSEPRDAPYVWVTWVSRLLAGDAQCSWAAWFRAHHMYERQATDLTRWAAEHAAMVCEQAETLKKAAYSVLLEDQNRIRLRGQSGVTLGGKPDIVAWRDGEGLIVECKTGQPRHADRIQVMIYMLVLPHAQPIWRGRTLTGRVQYRSGSVDVPADDLDPVFRTRFRDMMAQVGGGAAPGRVPSFYECRYCDIGKADCPERIESLPPDKAGEHDLF
ncbi:MAG: PD-(D/E)XK nuclease family protein [Candidatus Tectomicrobia bacterium]|nr:PD-(D/E)XK nuclease family protein [Candidatus Tectomicrobia bacterium]